jgi:hypothetical protein
MTFHLHPEQRDRNLPSLLALPLAKLWNAFAVTLLLVAERHWLKLEDGLARLVHGFNVGLKTGEE